MSERLESFGRGTSVALITFTTPDRLAGYTERRRLDYPILVDADRSTYRAYGLGRASVRRVWGARSLLRYAQIVRAGGARDLRRPTEDTRQLGADFVVAPDGTLAFGWWSSGPDDRPEVDRLIEAVATFEW